MKELRKVYDEKTKWSVEELADTNDFVKLKKNGLYPSALQSELTIGRTEINNLIEMLKQFSLEQ